MTAVRVAGWVAIGCLIWAATASLLLAWIHVATRAPAPRPRTDLDRAVDESLPAMWQQVHAALKRRQP